MVTSTFLGASIYRTGPSRTARQVSFRVAVQSGLSNAFFYIDGSNAFPPFVGELGNWKGINGGQAQTAPTTNQIIANYRADYIARYLSIYSPLVQLHIINYDQGSSETANAVVLTYETYVNNIYPSVSDITDTLGAINGITKTKPGLQTLATDLISDASLDGGNTLLYSANPALPDGTVSTASAITSLTVTMLTTSMYS